MDSVVLGFKGPVRYTAKKSGEVYDAYYLCITNDLVRNWQGVRAEEIFVRSDRLKLKDGKPLQLEDAVRVSYNRFGNIDSVEVL